MAAAYYRSAMKTLTVRLPEPLAAEIEAESRARRLSKSDVVRERLQRAPAAASDDPLASIRDLIGSVDGGPPDLSERKNEYLRAIIRGRKHPR
jgi:Arc/MetJ-type ribon-helix-helix transcriptional regulator